MSRTYDALRKAEAERAKKEGRPETDEFTDSESPRVVDFSLSSSVEQQYESIETALIASTKTPRIETIMIVGCNHGDGVTTVASFLAKMMANGRSVLLVDANLRTPALEKVLRVRSNGGFSDLLACKASLDEVINQTEIPNLSVMTSGSVSLAAPHLYRAGTFDELLASLKEKFDYVLFDAPPMSMHLDATFLASRVDGVILVVKAESTQVEEAQEVKKRLDNVEARILGVVVNKTQDYVPRFIRRLLS